MKTIYRLFILLNIFFFSCQALFSQKPFKSLGKEFTYSNIKGSTDTIMPESFYSGTLSLDTSLNGGYVSGTNGYGDLAKAQIFDMPENYSYFVKGVGLLIGDLDLSTPAASLTLGIHAIDGNGYFESGYDTSGAPGYVYAQINVPANILINNQLNIIEFTEEVFMRDTYALSLSFENFADNILGLISTSDGDANGSERAWEKASDGQWYAMLNAWGWDADMGIFSIINATSAFSKNLILSELAIKAYPNPASGEILGLEINSTLDTQIIIELFDRQGKQIIVYPPYQIFSGHQNIELDINSLNTGKYYLRINANNQNIVKKIIIF